ncbi:sensor domain-containing diguanylate cyclase [Kosmotoga pacifica]|uniref:sensor domain-containing diguanylate cyclase n=1 Tax=Kosmotoga pacifica TaxID=1330330 RepID=UPI000A500498|nr:diguanylate cyclase [Kosmotoga pacifica]
MNVRKVDYLIIFSIAFLCFLTAIIALITFPHASITWSTTIFKFMVFVGLFLGMVLVSKLRIITLTLGLGLFSYARFLGFVGTLISSEPPFPGNWPVLVHIVAAVLTAYAGIIAINSMLIYRKKYQEFFDNTSELILIVDKERDSIIEANKVAIDYFGKDLTNKGTGKCLDERNKSALCSKIRNSKGGFPKTFEEILYKHDGSPFYADILIDEFDIMKRVYYLISIRDISDRKQAELIAENEHERFKGLFEKNNDAVFFFDLDGKYIDANEKAVELLGYTIEELKSKTFRDVVASEELNEAKQILSDLKTKGSLRVYERTFVRKDGTKIPVEINIALIRSSDGNFDHIQSIVRDISERKKAEALIKAERDKFQKYLDVAQAAIVILDSSGKIKYLNIEGFKILRYSIDEMDEVVEKDAFEEFVPESNREKAREIFGKLVSGEVKSVSNILIPLLTKKGETKMILWSGIGLEDADGNIIEILLSGKDVTEIHNRQMKLEKFSGFHSSLNKVIMNILLEGINENSYQKILEECVTAIPDAQAGSVIVKDERGLFKFAAATNCDISGLKGIHLKPEELVHGNLKNTSIIKGPLSSRLNDKLLKTIMTKGKLVEEVKALLVIPIVIDDKIEACFILANFDTERAFSDATTLELAEKFGESASVLIERLKLEEALKIQKMKLEFLSNHDTLTELPNRRFLREHSELIFALARRNARPVSILYADLDGFKEINDKLGHDVGDYVLKEVAKRFRNSLRKSDIVARLGGDEFAFLFPETDSKMAVVAAERILLSLEKPIIFNNIKLNISGSIGISCFPEHGKDLKELLKKADSAMYLAKKKGLKIAVYKE